MANSDRDNSAARLVGRLIRSYRGDAERNGRRLSQDGLIDLMIERGEDYAEGLDRSSVSRWESGVRLAPQEFLVAFGRALDVPEGEMDLILSLAGYESLGDEEGRAAILTAARSIESQVADLTSELRRLAESAGPPEPAVDTSTVLKSALRRLALPGVYALVVGFVLNAMGQDGTLALLAYVLVALAIVIGQWAFRSLNPDRDRSEHDPVVDLFFISMFFTLNTSLLIGTLTKADHFGFYTIDAFTNTPMPFLLTMLVNLALSITASIMLSVLWSYRLGADGKRTILSRGVWVTLPPILFTYFSILIFTNLGAWISFMIILGALFGAFTIIVSLSEPGMVVGDADFLLRATIVTIALLCSFGVLGALVAYVDTDMMPTAAEIRIIPLPEISAEALGYTPDEGPKLLRLGTLWMSLANIAYLAVVVGGYMVITIRRVALRG